MTKTNEKYSELSKMKGKRVREFRKAAGLTQEQLAEKCNLEPNYISGFETGRESLTQKAAEKIGMELNAPVEYLMCRTDSKYPTSFYNDPIITEDSLFIKYLLHRDYEIKATIILIYETNQPQITVPVHTISGLNFCNSHCIYNDGERQQEVIVSDMIVNGFQMPFNVFCFAMTTIYRYIDFTINNIPHFTEDFIAHYNRRESDTYIINTSFPDNESSPQDIIYNLQQIELSSELHPDGTIKIGNEKIPANRFETSNKKTHSKTKRSKK